MNAAASTKHPKRILVIDVGGTHVKVIATGHDERRKFDSSPKLTPSQMVAGVKRITRDWKYDAVSIGCPGFIVSGKHVSEPVNLGKGWVGFNFQEAFGCPVKLVNDAQMQALGSYHGGRMLFLGLGTGLGSAMIVEGIVQPMELAHLPYKKGKTYEDYLGLRGLRRLGKKKWRTHVEDVVIRLTAALEPDYVVLGGGNAKELKDLPPKAELGANENAFQGGFRLWQAKG